VFEERAMSPQTTGGTTQPQAESVRRLPPSWPRPEARLYEWKQLTEEQRHALSQAAAIFQTLAKRQWPPPPPLEPRPTRWSFLQQIEQDRFNHNVLIDGGRGTGKTVVLLHLVNYWNKLLERDGVIEPGSDVDHIDVLTQQRVHEREGVAVDPPADPDAAPSRRQYAIVPVGIVDMQPLPRSTNLDLFLCSHFERVVTAIEQSHGGASSADDRAAPRDDVRARKAPWAALRGDLRSRELWAELRDAAALGSDHIEQRRAHLDVETYALELEAAERSRKLNAAFSRFIDALVRDFRESPLRGGAVRTPFFIVAIDDADMNLRRSVQMLESLRQLSHDRVGYVLTGHTDLFVILLRNRIAGGLRDPLQRLDLEERDDQIGADFAVSQQMANQIYDKVIPSAHRCVLRPLALQYRRAQIAPDLVGWNLPVEPLPVERGSPTKQGAPQARTVIQRPLDEYLGYYALPVGALPETWRGLQDLREVLAPGGTGNHGRDGARRDTPRLIRDLWHDRLDGSPLSPNDRQLLRDVVRIEEVEEQGTMGVGMGTAPVPRPAPPGVPALEPLVRSGKFVVQSTRLTRDIYPRRLQNGRIEIAVAGWAHRAGVDRPGEATFAIGELLGYEFRYQNDAGRTVGLLTEGAASALILATDVAADLTTGTFLGKALSPEEFDHPLFTVSVYDEFFSKSFEFCWPLPDWDAFVDFHLASRRWSHVVREVIGFTYAPSGTDLLDALAFPFVAIAVEVAFARQHPVGDLFGALPAGCDSLIEAWLARFRFCMNDSTLVGTPRWFLPGAIADEPDDPDGSLTFATLWSRLAAGLVKLSFETQFQRDFDAREWARTRVPLLAFPESGLSRTGQQAVLDHLVRPVLALGTRELSAAALRTAVRTNAGIAAARRLRARKARLAAGKERSTTLEQWSYRRGNEEFSTDQLVSLLLLPFGAARDAFAEQLRVRTRQRRRSSAPKASDAVLPPLASPEDRGIVES
jgi:hypothetical protein